MQKHRRNEYGTNTSVKRYRGIIPIVLAKGEPGKEILYPAASVILSGIVTSTLLDMIVTPTIFFHFGKPAIEKYLQAQKEGEVLHF